jgi:transcriptional regulator with XRE-family HTH domain
MNEVNEKLKSLRKNRDLTQEQIADIFHVSPQAVSRWETGVSFPDIEMLPHIAGFFNVTVDELLGTELILGEKDAGEYKKKIWDLLSLGKVKEAIDKARGAVKKYPVNYDLQIELMNVLCIPCDNQEKYKNEIIEIGERIINYCTNLNICLRAKHMLFMRYVNWGMNDKAKEIVYTLPSEEWYTYGANVGYVLCGEEWRQNQMTCIIRYTYQLCYAIVDYLNKSDAEPLQKIELYKKTMRIFGEIYDDEMDMIFNAPSDFYNTFISRLYCEAGDVENALIYLEKATQDAVKHVNNKWNGYSSSLLIERRFEHEHMERATTRNVCWMLWEDWFIKPEFDIIRNDARFIKCFELLKANSREV